MEWPKAWSSRFSGAMSRNVSKGPTSADPRRPEVVFHRSGLSNDRPDWSHSPQRSMHLLIVEPTAGRTPRQAPQRPKHPQCPKHAETPETPQHPPRVRRHSNPPTRLLSHTAHRHVVPGLPFFGLLQFAQAEPLSALQIRPGLTLHTPQGPSRPGPLSPFHPLFE